MTQGERQGIERAVARRTVMHAAWAVPVAMLAVATPAAAASRDPYIELEVYLDEGDMNFGVSTYEAPDVHIGVTFRIDSWVGDIPTTLRGGTTVPSGQARARYSASDPIFIGVTGFTASAKILGREYQSNFVPLPTE